LIKTKKLKYRTDLDVELILKLSRCTRTLSSSP